MRGKPQIYLLLISILSIPFLQNCSSNNKVDDLSYFGFEIEESIQNDNPDLLNDSFDSATFSGFTAHKAGLKEKIYVQVIAKQMKSSIRLGDLMTTFKIKSDGNFRFINHYEEDGYQHLVFKLSTDDNEMINYFDFTIFRKEKEQRIRVIDLFIFSEGNSISDFYVQMLMGIKQKIENKDNTLSSDVANLKEVTRFTNLYRYEEALESLEKVSLEFRARPMFLKRKINLLSLVGDDEAFLKAFDEYQRLFPKDGKFINFYKMLMAETEEELKKYAKPIIKYIQEQDYKSI